MPMHPNHALLEKFYSCFQKRDAAGMAECYRPDVEFSDPVFPGLKGQQAKDMWEMLCKRGKDLTLDFQVKSANDTRGSAHWDAYYTFSATGRKVHNIIEAEFEFADGRILRHRDRFDLWRWARMALGAKGMLLGWLPAVQKAIRAQAARGLADFSAKKSQS